MRVVKFSELETKLRDWADEYAGGRYDATGWQGSSPMVSLMKYHGRAPQGLSPRAIINTTGDRVESAVQKLATTDRVGKICAAVLRSEYWMPNAAMTHRMQRLHADGVFISLADYPRALEAGRKAVARALGVSYQPRFEDRRHA